jgi:hypothetical protein
MLEGFIDYSNDLASKYAGSWSKISDLNSQKFEQKQEYEEKLKEKEEQIKELEEALELEEETSECHLVLSKWLNSGE